MRRKGSRKLYFTARGLNRSHKYDGAKLFVHLYISIARLIKIESYHAWVDQYKAKFYHYRRNAELFLEFFSSFLEFFLPQKNHVIGQYVKFEAIKVLNICNRLSSFRCFEILFNAFICRDALVQIFEIWSLNFNLLSNVMPSTLILSQDGIVWPWTEIEDGTNPFRSIAKNWNLSAFASISLSLNHDIAFSESLSIDVITEDTDLLWVHKWLS